MAGRPFIQYIKSLPWPDKDKWTEHEFEALERSLSSMWPTEWRDQLGNVTLRSSGSNDPTFEVYQGSLRGFQCRANPTRTDFYFEFHIQHDYKPASDLYLHVHWSQIVVDSGGTAGAPGTAEWFFEVSYAKGHQQAGFSTPITLSVTQAASSTQYMHNIAEVQLSATSPTATQLDSDDIEPDGVILVRLYTTVGAGSNTLNQRPFVHYVDLHYQVDRFGTKNKVPDFYL